VKGISRGWTGCPARRPFRAGSAARAASRATPRVISVAAAQAASSCRARPGDWERSIGPADGPAPSSAVLASRSAVSDPSHRHLCSAASSMAGVLRYVHQVGDQAEHLRHFLAFHVRVVLDDADGHGDAVTGDLRDIRAVPKDRRHPCRGDVAFSRISTWVRAISRAIRGVPGKFLPGSQIRSSVNRCGTIPSPDPAVYARRLPCPCRPGRTACPAAPGWRRRSAAAPAAAGTARNHSRSRSSRTRPPPRPLSLAFNLCCLPGNSLPVLSGVSL